MFVHWKASDANRGHVSLAQAWNKQCFPWSNQPKGMPLQVPGNLPWARDPEKVKYVQEAGIIMDLFGQLPSFAASAAFYWFPMVLFRNHNLKTNLS